jgi:hypothetical protein
MDASAIYLRQTLNELLKITRRNQCAPAVFSRNQVASLNRSENCRTPDTRSLNGLPDCE